MYYQCEEDVKFKKSCDEGGGLYEGCGGWRGEEI
jgi:hypothetical protein